MYGLLALVTEKIAEKKWEDLVTDLIFHPLNMTSTTFMYTANLSELDLATAYLPTANGSLRMLSWDLQRSV